MQQFIFANNIKTTLGLALPPSGTTLTLVSSVGLPTLGAGQVIPITIFDAATALINEVCYITAIVGTACTVLRAQEGTTAQNWSIGDFALACPTAGSVAAQFGNPSNVFKVATPTAPDEAVRNSQLAGYALINGDPAETFEVADATTNSEAVNLGQLNAPRGTQGNMAQTFSYTIPGSTAYYDLSGHSWTLSAAENDGFLQIHTANNVTTPNITGGVGLVILVNGSLVVGDSILGSQSQSAVIPISKGATPTIQIQVANFSTVATSQMSTVTSWLFTTA